MSRRKRRRGPRPAALFEWTRPASADVVPADADVDPRTVRCEHPPCRAREGFGCTTHDGRPLKRPDGQPDYHDSRRQKARAATGSPAPEPTTEDDHS